MNERMSALSSMTNATGLVSSAVICCSESNSVDGRLEQANKLSGESWRLMYELDVIVSFGTDGMVIVMLVPVAPVVWLSILDSISTLPPISSAYFFTKASPMPDPSWFELSN